MHDFAKILIVTGFIIMAVGVGILVVGKIPGAGRLPGDILIKKENFTVYFPLTTCIFISVILSLVFYLWNQK